MEIDTYYFTFGSNENMPFQNGWIEIEAPNMQSAIDVFRIYFPNTIHQDLINCAKCYSQEEFAETQMDKNGNFGARCHMKISCIDCEKENKQEIRIRQLENILRDVVNFELEEPELAIAKDNLFAMGFSEKDMSAFGFPEII